MSEYTLHVNQRILNDEQRFLGNAQTKTKISLKNGQDNANAKQKDSAEMLLSVRKEKKQLEEGRLSKKLRQELQTQPHLRTLSHHTADTEFELKLRKVATLGFLKFLNATSQRVSDGFYAKKSSRYHTKRKRKD